MRSRNNVTVAVTNVQGVFGINVGNVSRTANMMKILN